MYRERSFRVGGDEMFLYKSCHVGMIHAVRRCFLEVELGTAPRPTAGVVVDLVACSHTEPGRDGAGRTSKHNVLQGSEQANRRQTPSLTSSRDTYRFCLWALPNLSLVLRLFWLG